MGRILSVENPNGGANNPVAFEYNIEMHAEPVGRWDITADTLCFVNTEGVIVPVVFENQLEQYETIKTHNEFVRGTRFLYSKHNYSADDAHYGKELFSSCEGCDITQHGYVDTNYIDDKERVFLRVFPLNNFETYIIDDPNIGSNLLYSESNLVNGVYVLLGNVNTTDRTFFLEHENPMFIKSEDGLHELVTSVLGLKQDNLSADQMMSIHGWQNKVALSEDILLNQSHNPYSLTMSNRTSDSSYPPKGVYVITCHAMIGNSGGKPSQAHVMLKYRTSSNDSYTVIAAASVTLPTAESSLSGNENYGAIPVTLQGMITLPSSTNEFSAKMEVEVENNVSTLYASAPLSGNSKDALSTGASYIMMYLIGI